MTRKKTILMFYCENKLEFFLAPLMVFTLTGHSNQHRSSSTNYVQLLDSLLMLHFPCRSINFQSPMRMYSDIRYQKLQNVV